MQIDKRLYDEINSFCKENNLKTRDFIHKILKEAFLREKYGETPFPVNQIQLLSENQPETVVNTNHFEEKVITIPENNYWDSPDEEEEIFVPQEETVPPYNEPTVLGVESPKETVGPFTEKEAPKPKKKRKLT